LSFGGLGGGTSGEIRYVISVDDSQAVQKLQSVSQQFQQMPQALDQATASAGKFSQANADLAAELQATDIGAKEVTTSTQSFGSVMKQNIGAIVSVGSGILGLVSNYTSLQRTQLQINKLEVTEANQRRQLGVLTRQHAAAVEKYGATSQTALDIQAKIDILQQRNINTIEQLNIRKEQQTQAELALGLNVIQTGASIAQTLTGIKSYTKGTQAAKVATIGLTNSMRGLKIATGVGIILVALEVAAQAIANNWGNVQQKLDELYNWAVKVVPALRPVIDAIWTIGKALTALFTGDLDALNKMFSKTATTAPAASDGMGEFAESGKEVAKAAKEADKELEDMWNRINDFASAGLKGLVEASQGKKGEISDFLKRLGIKGDEKGRMKDFLDDIKDGVKELDQVRGKLQTIKGFDILQKLGFKIPKGVIKDMINTLDSDLRDVIKGKDDPFNQLADILKESKDKSLPAVEKIFTDFFGKNPKLLDALRQLDPELAAAIQAMIDEATLTEQTALDKVTLDPTQLKDTTEDVWNAAFAAPEVHRDFVNGVDVTKSPVQKFADDMITQLKKAFSAKSMEGVGEAIATAMFVTTPKIGAIIGKWFKDVFTLANFTNALSQILDTLKTVGTAVLMGITRFVGGFSKVAGPIITKWFKDTFTLENLAAGLKAVQDALKSVGIVALGLISEGLQSVKEFGSTALTWISKQLKDGKALKLILTVGELLGGTIMLGLQSLKDFGKTAIDWIYDQFVKVVDKMKDLGAIIGDKIIQGIKSIPEAFKSVWDFIYNTITGQAKGGSNKIPDKGSGSPYGGTPTGKYKGLTDEEIWSKFIPSDGGLVNPGQPRTPQSDAQEILQANIPDSDKRKLLAAIGRKYGFPETRSQFGFDELFPTDPAKPYGNVTPNAPPRKQNPSNLYQREQSGFTTTGRIPFDPSFGRTPGQQPGVGQQMLNAAGSGQFAQIAVGAQAAQKALANLAVQGGKSMQILANLILKNTTNLMGNFVTIAKQSQLAQTALANLAVQGGKSFQILANLILANTKNLLGNFVTINTVAQGSQTALANLANQGGNSMSILAKATGVHTKSMNTYLAKTIPIAAQKSQKSLANLSNEGSNSMSLLAKNSGKHTKSMNTYLAKTIPVAAQKSQTSLANLSNEGSKSMKALADATEKAASRIKSALNSIPSGGGGGGGGFSGFSGGGFDFASGGDFITSGPQMILVGESGRERVTVTPLGANASGGNGIGGATVNQTISLNISGSDLINQRNLTKRIKLTVGENRDKFG